MRRRQTWIILGIIAALALGLVALSRMTPWEVDDDTGIEPTTATSGQSSRTAQPERPAQPDAGEIPDAIDALPDRDLAIAPEDGVTLQGLVRNATGSGLADIEVEIESLVVTGGAITRIRSVTDARGEFSVAGLVPEMQYRLWIEPQQDYGGHRLDSFSASQPDALQDVVLLRIKLVEFNGMIVDTSLAPVPDFELTVRSLAVEFPERVIRSDSTGYFNLGAFPAGELRIATNASDYFQIKGLVLQPDEYRNLRLVIDKGSYHLSGWVSDDNGAPLGETQVTLKSAFRIDDYHSFSYRSAITDANGAFEFTGLGGYPLTIGAYANGFETYIRKHEFGSFSDRIEIRLRRQG